MSANWLALTRTGERWGEWAPVEMAHARLFPVKGIVGYSRRGYSHGTDTGGTPTLYGA